jgi:hypothetical protein
LTSEERIAFVVIAVNKRLSGKEYSCPCTPEVGFSCF